MAGFVKSHHISKIEQEGKRIMYFELDVLIKENELSKLKLPEIFAEWGGELFSQEPPKYIYNSKLIFERVMDIEHYQRYYKKFIDDDWNLNSYISLKLLGYVSHFNELGSLINKKDQGFSNNEVVLFLLDLLKLDTFAIFLIRDEEYIDKKYVISQEQELIDIITKSLNWSSPKGVLIYK